MSLWGPTGAALSLSWLGVWVWVRDLPSTALSFGPHSRGLLWERLAWDFSLVPLHSCTALSPARAQRGAPPL